MFGLFGCTAGPSSDFGETTTVFVDIAKFDAHLDLVSLQPLDIDWIGTGGCCLTRVVKSRYSFALGR